MTTPTRSVPVELLKGAVALIEQYVPFPTSAGNELRALLATPPAEPRRVTCRAAAGCIACEGIPSGDNVPCQVCGGDVPAESFDALLAAYAAVRRERDQLRAAIDSIVIDIPDSSQTHYGGDPVVCYENKVRTAIEGAGLKVRRMVEVEVDDLSGAAREWVLRHGADIENEDFVSVPADLLEGE